MILPDKWLDAFVAESNMIEGITRPPTFDELRATRSFILLDRGPTIADLEVLVAVYAPGKPLRRQFGMNVRVGPHIPLSGGPVIERELQRILDRISWDAWRTHVEYETLHPFMDGNGRSGRALWAWQMAHLYGGLPGISFLHWAYYQALQHSRPATTPDCLESGRGR